MSAPPRRLAITNQGGQVTVTRLVQRARSAPVTQEVLQMSEIDAHHKPTTAFYSPDGFIVMNLTASSKSVRSDFELEFPMAALQYALGQAGFLIIKNHKPEG